MDDIPIITGITVNGRVICPPSISRDELAAQTEQNIYLQTGGVANPGRKTTTTQRPLLLQQIAQNQQQLIQQQQQILQQQQQNSANQQQTPRPSQQNGRPNNQQNGNRPSQVNPNTL